MLTLSCSSQNGKQQIMGGKVISIMFETSKLRGRIIEKFGSQLAFAKAAHRSVSFVSQYLNCKKSLDQRMMDEWINLLDIPLNEIDQYFFVKKVHEAE